MFFSLCHDVKASDIWLKDISVKPLKSLYDQIGYDGQRGYLLLDTRSYPRIFLKNFPKDFTEISNETERTSLFIKILAPLALKTNEEIMSERQTVINIQNKFKKNKNLQKKEIKIIEDLANKYDVFSRLKQSDRIRYLLDELLIRVDIVPPSILITAAALETNWGSSRIVKEGNSLYKTLNWYTTEGLKPTGEKNDNTYRIKTYPDIYSSMKEFALTINTDIDFKDFRNLRKSQRRIYPILTGTMLAPYIFFASNLQNFAGLFEYTLTYYELLEIDKSKLTDKIIPEDISKKYTSYITSNKENNSGK